jgi:hypothetical protein
VTDPALGEARSADHGAGRADALRGDPGGGLFGPVGERMIMPPFYAAWPVGKGAVAACPCTGRSVSGPRARYSVRGSEIDGAPV